MTGLCGYGWSRASSPSEWLSRRTNRYGGRDRRTFVPTGLRRAYPPVRGGDCRQALAPKASALYDWALTELWRLQISPEERRFGHYLLVRRCLDEKQEHAYYIVYAPRSKVTKQTLVNVAGRRWEIEIGFEAAKGECGLDQYEVRHWQGWYRHITLALLAHAVLVTLRKRGKKKLLKA